MIDTYFRPYIQQQLVDPVVHFLSRSFLQPKTVTILAIILGIVFIPLISIGHTYLALTALLLSGFLDIIDGSLARLQGTASAAGAVFDIVGDRTVEFCVVLGLFLVAPEQRGLISILMLGSTLLCITSFLVVAIFQENQSEKSFHYSPGLMERAEAFTFFSLMVIIPSAFTVLGALFSLLVFTTAFIRVWQFAKHHS